MPSRLGAEWSYHPVCLRLNLNAWRPPQQPPPLCAVCVPFFFLLWFLRFNLLYYDRLPNCVPEHWEWSHCQIESCCLLTQSCQVHGCKLSNFGSLIFSLAYSYIACTTSTLFYCSNCHQHYQTMQWIWPRVLGRGNTFSLLFRFPFSISHNLKKGTGVQATPSVTP